MPKLSLRYISSRHGYSFYSEKKNSIPWDNIANLKQSPVGDMQNFLQWSRDEMCRTFLAHTDGIPW